jgi:hypothetical protein
LVGVFLFLLAAEGLNVLMEAVVSQHLFTGYSVGAQDPVTVSVNILGEW